MSDIEQANRPTRAEIRLGALRRNFGRARDLAGPATKVMAVVKADAYGHGMMRVAKELLAEGAAYLGVAIIEEAAQLRAAGIDAPILVLGSPPDADLPIFANLGVDLALASAAKARAASAAAVAAGKSIRAHLKIDTGMGRIGVDWRGIEAFAEELAGLPGLEIVGAFSHLATADCDVSFAREQVSRFGSALGVLARRDIEPPLVHIANSAALVALPEARFDMVRPGIFVYGYEPCPWEKVGVEPVMRLASRISFVKTLRAGEGVSYGRTWKAAIDTTIATVRASRESSTCRRERMAPFCRATSAPRRDLRSPGAGVLVDVIPHREPGADPRRHTRHLEGDTGAGATPPTGKGGSLQPQWQPQCRPRRIRQVP